MQAKTIEFSLIVAILTSFLFVVPAKFYLDLLQKQEDEKFEILLTNWGNELISKIRIFENKIDDIFIFPRSVYFDAVLEDEDRNVIFSTLSDYPKIVGNLEKIGGAIYKKIELDKNIFNAKYLIIKSPYNMDEFYLKLLLLIVIILPVFFFGSVALFTAFLRSFEETRKLEEFFFKDAMHEIKTPLGIIMLNLEILGEKMDQNIYIKRAKYGVKNLSLIYDDIEHFIRHKYVNYANEKINFSQMIQDRVLYFSEAASISNISISCDIESNIFIDFSKIELVRIIDNTLSNAIKYNKENGTIDLSLKKQEKSIVLVIKDSGKGIKEINKIFIRRYRGDEIKGGFGIGLSIVKAICDKRKVMIRVQSKVGEGSQFSYYFPASD